MNILKKIIIIIITIFTIFLLFIPNKSKALTLTDIMDGANKFFNNKEAEEEVFNEENERESIDTLFYAGIGIGIVIAFVIGMILGIQFIISGVEGQAKVKEKLIPYCVGCFVLFGAFGIWRIIYNVLQLAFS